MVWARDSTCSGGYRLLRTDDCFCIDINTACFLKYPLYTGNMEARNRAGKYSGQMFCRSLMMSSCIFTCLGVHLSMCYSSLNRLLSGRLHIVITHTHWQCFRSALFPHLAHVDLGLVAGRVKYSADNEDIGVHTFSSIR